MSYEIETKMKDHTAVTFWGGDERGVCMQITSIKEPMFIQLTMEEGASLINTLLIFVREEALRRQRILQEEIEQKQEFEKTIFREIADLPIDFYDIYKTKIDYVSVFCPKVQNKFEIEVTE